MNTLSHFLTALGALAFLAIGKGVNAQTDFFPVNTTINQDIGSNNAVVGYANESDQISSINGTSPTVNIVSGANIGGSVGIFNSSIVNVSGGTIGGDLSVADSSTVNFSGGILSQNLQVASNSMASVSGGTIGGNLAIFSSNPNPFNVSNAEINNLFSYLTTTVNLKSGIIDSFVASTGNSTINISGSTIGNNLFVQDSSRINLLGAGLNDSPTNSNITGYSQYLLFGHLQDGTNITGKSIYVQNTGASFAINGIVRSSSTPEPSSYVLFASLGLTASAVLRQRKAKKKR